MPRGDRTGPAGLGPMTGRRAGYCAGFNAPGFTGGAGRWGGFGFGGRGMGRGWRNMGYAAGVPGWQWFGGAPVPPAQEETEYLKSQASWLKDQLAAIEKRIEELGHS
ncbi:hypothetical protein ADN00_10105 [Ornatilinea apprima]|uniref:DUF5320 domain-containing protein n=2 Tax=Ornatilinea apprima TaxID=1134406 RepID=A0A0P6X2N1_9CHLR|nr:hypothetical protein ADN00_10105 [Ornatilinea apprima]